MQNDDQEYYRYSTIISNHYPHPVTTNKINLTSKNKNFVQHVALNHDNVPSDITVFKKKLYSQLLQRQLLLSFKSDSSSIRQFSLLINTGNRPIIIFIFHHRSKFSQSYPNFTSTLFARSDITLSLIHIQMCIRDRDTYIYMYITVRFLFLSYM